MSDKTDRSPYPTVRDSWINTISGKKFMYDNPREEDIDIEDIAHSLSMLCRYNGHIKKFFSVAEHSVLVSRYVPQEGKLPLWGLLHDAAEAYIGDLVTPLKHRLVQYMNVEEGVEATIFNKFGLEYDDFADEIIPPEVKEVDRRMLATECRDLLGSLHSEWIIVDEPYDFNIVGYTPDIARITFMARFEELTSAG